MGYVRKIYVSLYMDLRHDILMRGIKIVDIVFIYTLSVLYAFYVAIFLDKYVFDKTSKEEEDRKTYKQHLWEICGVIGVIGGVAYVGRNLIKLVPFPLDNFDGFRHGKVRELKSGVMLNVFLLMFSTTFVLKTTALKDKIMGGKI